MSTLEKEIIKVSGQAKQDKKEKDQVYYGRLARTLAEIDDESWDSLSEEGQTWANKAIKALNDGDKITGFGDEEEEDEAPVKTTKLKERTIKKSKAVVEDDEDDDEDEDDEDDEDDDDEPAVKSKGKKAKAVVEDDEDDDSDEEEENEDEPVVKSVKGKKAKSDNEEDDEDEDDELVKETKPKSKPVVEDDEEDDDADFEDDEQEDYDMPKKGKGKTKAASTQKSLIGDGSTKKRGALNEARKLICKKPKSSWEDIMAALEADGFTVSVSSIKMVLSDTLAVLAILKELGKLA